MIKNNFISAAGAVRNFAVHHRKTLLPYGIIFVVLAGIWVFWDEPETTTQTIRETKSTDSSSPVFSMPDADNTKETGTRIQSTAGTIRHRPLPDLFAHTAAGKEEISAQRNTAAISNAAGADKQASEIQRLPNVLGTMQNGTLRFVVLQSGNTTKVCAAGESIDGYYVAYIGEWAVGLQKDGQIMEISL